MSSEWTRRQWLAGIGAVAGTGLATGLLPAQQAATGNLAREEPFGYCLNTSTLQGQKLDLVQLVDIAAQAGYQAIEPWVRELEHCWQDTRDSQPKPVLRFDLTAVTFIDAAGKAFLAARHADGAVAGDH